MSIYTLMGADAEQAFTSSWGLSFGMGQISEWYHLPPSRAPLTRFTALVRPLHCLAARRQDILTEAVKGVFVLVILDQLRLVPVGKWMERHLDILSIQAVLLKQYVHGRAPTTWEQLWQYKVGSHVARSRGAAPQPIASAGHTPASGHVMACHLQSPQVFMSQVG